MSEVHKFIFNGLPVRGIVVRLTDTWVEILRRRASNTSVGAYPVPVRDMLGELVAAATLMQANIKFDGAMVLQVFGDGPVKLAVVEVQSDFSLRATATVIGTADDATTLSQMVNVSGAGRCAITLDPKTKFPGQQPYQGVVPLIDSKGQQIKQINELLEHYMLQSEQLDTTLVLAANEEVAAGLLIQRLPMQGSANLSGSTVGQDGDDQIGLNEDYNRIAVLASSLKRNELLTLDVDTILHRLFWEERITRFEPLRGASGPRFSCSCSRERVGRMILSLGLEETKGILHERGNIEVACEFCGLQYHFDAIDALQLFASPEGGVSAGSGPH